MKTNKLTGAALDWAVAKCEGLVNDRGSWTLEATMLSITDKAYEPSADWAQGGAITERERICLIDQGGDYWQAMCGWKESFGNTPLEAAMRCYVASKLGDEVDVPELLTETTEGY
jgi:hypothetical protein